MPGVGKRRLDFGQPEVRHRQLEGNRDTVRIEGFRELFRGALHDAAGKLVGIGHDGRRRRLQIPDKAQFREAQ